MPNPIETSPQVPSTRDTPAKTLDITQQQQQQPFRLLDLPPELLLCIISLTVVQQTPICMHGPDAQPPTPPPITRTNRLLRQEGLKTFYARNIFHSVNWLSPRPRDWLKSVPEAWREGMHSVLVSSGWGLEDVAGHFRGAGVACRARKADDDGVKLLKCEAAGDTHLYALSFGK